MRARSGLLAVLWLSMLGCASDIQRTGDLPEPTAPPLAVDWKYLRPPINDLFFLDTRTGWGVGNNGLVVITHDGGSTWEPKVDRLRRYFSKVWAVDARNAWALGSRAILATHDGGSTWDTQFEFQMEGPRVLWFIDNRRGWVAGDTRFPLEGFIRATTNGGKTWEEQATTPGILFTSLQFLNSDVGWAIGAKGTILATRDGGHRWQPQSSPVTADLLSVFFLDERNGWISHGGGVIHTADGGEHWTPFSWPGVYFLNLRFTDPLNGLAYAYVEGELALLSTVDGGRSWAKLVQLEEQGDFFVFKDSFRFLDSQNAYLFDRFSNDVRWGTNGGKTWTQRRKEQPAASLQFLDSSHGWGLTQGGLLVTTDGGSAWRPIATPGFQFRCVHFVDAATGWAVTRQGDLVSTTTGGRSWNPSGEKPDFARSIYFANPQTGWIVGEEGKVLKTESGGRRWSPQRSGIETTLLDVVFLDRKKGWAAGEGGVILTTEDGGDHWTRQTESREDTLLIALAFANASTGWAVGSRNDNALFLATTDGGRTWVAESRLAFGDALTAAAFAPPDRVRLLGRKEPMEATTLLAEGRVSGIGPSVQELQAEGQPDGSVLLSFRARDEHPATVQLSKLEFLRPGPAADWGSIQLSAAAKASPEGVIPVRWEPRKYGIDDGDSITYRATLRDDTGLEFTQEIERAFVYHSWWSQPGGQAAILGGGLLTGYATLCLSLLWLSPLALLWIHRRVPFQEMIDQVPVKGFGILAGFVLAATGLNTLARHRRTRRAWEARYRAGRAKFSDLPPELRASYVEDTGCLDAWVERRANAAREALDRIDAVHQRRIYIELPVRLGPREENRHLPDPMPPALRDLFAAPCAVVAVLGEGGTGKSTLACQLARWSLADDPASRLAPCRMIPVMLGEETTDLVSSVTGQLRTMVGDEEVDPDIVLSLLRSKRLLVFVDALSECNPATQRHVESIHRSTPVNALLVTARRPPDFGPVPVVDLWPEKISAEKLVYFLVEYLRRTGNDGLFPERQGLQLADRLLGVVERGGEGVEVTPLLIKLFVDQAIALRRAGEPLEKLPTTIAETMLESLRRTNPPYPQMPNYVDDATLILAARVLGRCSLEYDFIPRDFERDRAEAELAREGIRYKEADLVARLIDNGVLQERAPGGTRFLRFTLDPLAEYLAALSWLATLRDDQEGWKAWLARLRGTEGYPDRVRGFLVAFQDCLQIYRDDYRIPTVVVVPPGADG